MSLLKVLEVTSGTESNVAVKELVSKDTFKSNAW